MRSFFLFRPSLTTRWPSSSHSRGNALPFSIVRRARMMTRSETVLILQRNFLPYPIGGRFVQYQDGFPKTRCLLKLPRVSQEFSCVCRNDSTVSIENPTVSNQ